MKIVIADSSTLIVLLDTDNFSLLFKLFKEITISQEVYSEITQKIYNKKELDSYIASNIIKVVSVEHDDRYNMLIKRLDKGEAESIALAKKLELPLIIDERKGRNIAKSLGIKIIGFVGIILKLLDKKIISKTKALKIIQDAEENDFRLSDELKNLIYNY